VRRFFPPPRALALTLLAASASAATAQVPATKLDPLLRPLVDPAVIARIEATPRVEAVGAALRRPLADVVVLRRERGRSGMFVDVFVSLSERSPAVIEALGGRVIARAGTLFGARVPLSALRALGADSRVRYVKAARRVKPNNDLAMQDIRASLVRTRSNGIFTGATGSNVIVGTFDTGIDWSHPDFKHPDGTTRILYVWDLSTTGAPPGNVGGQVFDGGNECSAALITAGACSERDVAAHGSHVAGIAAGDGSGGSPYQYTGVAPNADIIAVKGGDVSFSFADVLAGIEYIFKRADILGRPAVVNLSLGSDYGAHDGTESEEQAIDSLVGPGHIVVIAAGNSGSNPTAIEGNSPISYLHATRTLITGDTAQLGVTVPVYTAASGSIDDYMLFTMWYDARDFVTITVRRPDGTTFARSTGDAAAHDEAAAGHIYLDNASEGPAPQNGDRQADIEMYDDDPTHPPAAGTWVITIRLDRLGGSGRFDVWEYLASSTLAGSQISGGGDNAYLVSTPGNAARAITVAAHVNRVNWISQSGGFQFSVREQVGDLATFSSPGPTRPVRDSLPSRQKPDLSAPGKGVFSVYSSMSSPPAPGALIAPDGAHVLISGTSMSTPMVTGSVALLLERKPDLTPEQVRTILTGSARQDGFTGVSYAGFGGGVPNPSWGYGKLDVQAALAQVPLNLTATKGPRGDSLGGRFVLPRANVPSIQLRVVGDSVNDTRVTGIALQSTGSGSEPLAVTAVRLYADEDSNGVVGPGDVLLGSATVTQDDGEAALGSLSFTVARGTTGYLLGAYDLNGTPRQGDTFRLSLLASSGVTAQRVSDGAAVSLSGGRVTGSAVVVQLVGSVAAASGGGLVSPVAGLGGPNAVLLRMDATAASPETVSVRRLVGRFGGTANPAAALENVRLVRDVNDNGVVDAGDLVEGVLATAVTGPALTVDLPAPGDPRLPSGITRRWLVVAGIKAGAVESTTVSFTLDSLGGRGLVTDSAVIATGPPLAGASVTLVSTTLALGGPLPDSVEVLRGQFVTLARLRLTVQGEPVRIDTMLFQVTGSLPVSRLGNFLLFQDVDSNGVKDVNDVDVAFLQLAAPGNVIRMAPYPGSALAAGTHWWGLLAIIGSDATWGQMTQVRLDGSAIFARGTASGVLPAHLGAASLTGRLHSVGGQAELTAAGTQPPAGRLRIGTNAALPFIVSASTLEGARLDTITVAGASTHALSDIVAELDLYRDSTGAGTVPSGPPLVALTAPFAAGATLSFAAGGTSVAPGGQVTYLLALRLNDRLRQGDTLGLRVVAVSGTGALSARRAAASIPAPVASRLGPAALLQGDEVVLVSENPVRSGRVIFSYDLPPRSLALYTFAGLRVRQFTGLPASRFEWDVRGESPGLPNGMYILVVDTGSQLLRRRLMILSPSP